MSEIDHFILEPAKFRLDGGAMFGIIPRPMWSKVAPPDEQNRIDLALRLWLIKDGKRIILTDTGIGDYHNDKFVKRFDLRSEASPLEKALKELNISPDQVTDLVISHLHFDHVGGINTIDNNNNSLPVFKNATLHLHKRHYKYAQKPSDKDSGSFHHKLFDPIIKFYQMNKKINWLTGAKGEILTFSNGEKLKFLTSNGHTPFLIHPYTEHYIYLADIIPTAHHVHIPWVMAYDINPAITTTDKKEILNFINEKKLKIIFEHDPVNYGASIKKDERNRFVVNRALESKEQIAYLISSIRF